MQVAVVCLRLNNEALEKSFGDYLSSQEDPPECIENGVYDYIQDEEYNKNFQVHFPDLPKDMILVKKSINNGYDDEFYMGYILKDSSDITKAAGVKALEEFRQKFPSFVKDDKITTRYTKKLKSARL